MPHRPRSVITACALAVCSATAAFAQEEGDGAPHIAIADTGTELELEFAVEAGLDESGPVPILTLDTSVFDPFFGGFRTFPVNETPSPNDDLGFVSEVEGSGEEGGAINGNIVVRLLNRSDNFTAFFEGNELFTESDDFEFSLGSAFDTHPIWVAQNAADDFTSATASFEVFNTAGTTPESLGQFNLVLAVPEPASAGLIAAGALLIARRRRSGL